MKSKHALVGFGIMFLVTGCVETVAVTSASTEPASLPIKSSAFEKGGAFNSYACLVPTGSNAQLPSVFVTPDFYSGATEVGDEARVSAFKTYFQRLSSRARVDALAATTARATIIEIAEEDLLRWSNNWLENSSNVFYFTTSALLTVAVEYYHQKAKFTDAERKAIEGYLLRRWRQLSQTSVLTAPLIDNKYAKYAAFSYAVGLAADNLQAKQAGIKAYQRVIREMRPDGSNPMDSTRAGSAIHYTNLNVAALVTAAELAAIDDIDLYSFQGRNGGIDQAIDFLMAATRDPSLISGYARADGSGFQGYSPANQDIRWPGKDSAAWVAIYARRFSGTARTKSLLDLTRGLPVQSKLISDHSAGNSLCWTSGR